jgi:amino acid transporter
LNSSERNRIVRTIWGGGRSYRLTPRFYVIYQIYNTISWIVIVTLAIFSILIKPDPIEIGPIILRYSLPLGLLLAFAPLAVLGQIAIATRGVRTADRPREDDRRSQEKRFRFQLIRKLIACIFLAVSIIISSVGRHINNKPINISEIVVFLAVLVIFILILRSLYSKR